MDRQPAIEFSFDGSDEGDRISGRGWAVLESDALHGRVLIHHGDESSSVARRAADVGAVRQAEATMKRTRALVRLEKKLASDPPPF